MEKLTDKQRKILEFIDREIRMNGYPPSVREIGLAVGLSSPSTVHGYLERLEQAGYIKKSPSKNRAYTIVDNDYTSSKDDNYVEVPIVGKITAGMPILATEQFEGNFPIPMEYLRNDEYFFLHVSGDSMINAGIFDGDYVLIRKTDTARNGEIVAAMVEDEATIKRFYKENGGYRLQPENDYMDPIIVKEVSIIGSVTGLIRMNLQ